MNAITTTKLLLLYNAREALYFFSNRILLLQNSAYREDMQNRIAYITEMLTHQVDDGNRDIDIWASRIFNAIENINAALNNPAQWRPELPIITWRNGRDELLVNIMNEGDERIIVTHNSNSTNNLDVSPIELDQPDFQTLMSSYAGEIGKMI
jgi:hypothetical protein